MGSCQSSMGEILGEEASNVASGRHYGHLPGLGDFHHYLHTVVDAEPELVPKHRDFVCILRSGSCRRRGHDGHGKPHARSGLNASAQRERPSTALHGSEEEFDDVAYGRAQGLTSARFSEPLALGRADRRCQVAAVSPLLPEGSDFWRSLPLGPRLGGGLRSPPLSLFFDALPNPCPLLSPLSLGAPPDPALRALGREAGGTTEDLWPKRAIVSRCASRRGRPPGFERFGKSPM